MKRHSDFPGIALAPYQLDDGWYFWAEGRTLGPYATKATAEQRREDYAAYRTTSVACHCRAVAQ